MAKSKERKEAVMVDLSSIVLPHPFESELDLLVKRPLVLTLEALDRFETETTADIERSFGRDDVEAMRSATSQFSFECENIARAATNLALVNLVSRLEHWVLAIEQRLVSSAPRGIRTRKQTSKGKPQSALVSKLMFLNAALGTGPTEIMFLDQLDTARNSVVHHDSKASWHERGKSRSVEKRYANQYGELEFGPAHLDEAIEKTKKQIVWYEERLHELRNSYPDSAVSLQT